MSERSISLIQRRSALRTHCEIQRAELARTADLIEGHLDPIDRGIDTVRRIATRPAVVIGVVALLALLGPKRVLGWAGSSAVLLTTGRRVLRLLR